MYQYFAGSPTLGGTMSRAEYCPTTNRYGNRLCYDSSQLGALRCDVGEARCATCLCFQFALKTAPATSIAGCLDTRCVGGALQINAENSWQSCPLAGGAITLGTTIVQCPPSEQLCTYEELARAASYPKRLCDDSLITYSDGTERWGGFF